MRKNRISIGMVAAIALSVAWYIKQRNARLRAAALANQTISSAVRSSGAVFPH